MVICSNNSTMKYFLWYRTLPIEKSKIISINCISFDDDVTCVESISQPKEFVKETGNSLRFGNNQPYVLRFMVHTSSMHFTFLGLMPKIHVALG